MDRTERGKVGRVDQGITDRPKERAAFAGRRIVFHKVPICFHLYGMIISCGNEEHERGGLCGKHQKYLKNRAFCPFCLTTGRKVYDFSSEMGMTCGAFRSYTYSVKRGMARKCHF